MKYIDQHVHTNISHDGISTFEEYVNYAKNHNVIEITTTEHFDDYTGIETNLKSLNIDEYRNNFYNFKKNSLFNLNFGIEIGLRPESQSVISEIVKTNSFDLIIGSSHITCGIDMANDESFFRQKSANEAIMNYFTEVLTNVNQYKNEFDIYGHLDYVTRYVIKYYGKVMSKINYYEFREILDEILLAIIKFDKGIEINTSGIRYGLNSCHPNIDILKRYRELGGKIITIGSDAHNSLDLANNFNIAYSILEYLGFKNIAIYHNRQPEFIKIKKLR